MLRHVPARRFRPCCVIDLLLILVAIAMPGIAWANQPTVAEPTAAPAPFDERFDQWEIGSWPGTWIIEAGNGECVIRAAEGDASGRSMRVKPENAQSGPVVATMSIDATMFSHGWHRALIRLRQASVGGVASFWIQAVDEDGMAIATASSHMHPATDMRWRESSVLVEIPQKTRTIEVGVVSVGGDGVDVDHLTIAPGVAPRSLARPPERLSDQEQRNLVALAKLWGPVRYFHASNASLHASWNPLTIQMVREMCIAVDDTSAAEALARGFAAVCPLLTISPSDAPPRNAVVPEGASAVSQMVYKGFAEPFSAIGVAQPIGSAFGCSRLIQEITGADDELPVAINERIELGNGWVAAMPPAWLDDRDNDVPTPGIHAYTDDELNDPMTHEDRAVRLATVIATWGTLSQFHPNLHRVTRNWDAALVDALHAAAVAPGADALASTLETLVAALGDGQAAVAIPGAVFRAPLPISARFIDEELVVMAADPGTGAAPGDVIVAIDAITVEELARTLRPRVSASTDGHANLLLAQRTLVTNAIATADNELKGWATVDLRRPDGTTRSSRVVPRATFERPTLSQPENGTLVAPGIVYLNLSLLNNIALRELMPTLKDAKGLLLDARGQPDQGAVLLLRMLSDVPLGGASVQVPILKRPLQRDLAQHVIGWTLPPAPPKLESKVVFLADAGTIAFAESLLEIAEHNRIGRVVGEPTAGTVGDVNVLHLPGEGAIQFTGASATKQDGSPMHGTGVIPSEAVALTIEGLAAGRDEILDRALELLKAELDAATAR